MEASRQSKGESSSFPTGEAQGLGVYIHFPWCLAKCPYCDFVSFAAEPDTIDHEGYADLVLKELSQRREAFGGRDVLSVFVGGGTPSLWEPEALGRVLRGLASLSGCDLSSIEVTAECNPSSLNARQAQGMVAAGINRFSVGVQGLEAERLSFLGRWHDADEALRAVQTALESGVKVVSADLIYGVAAGSGGGQRPAEAAREAKTVAALGVQHVSAYQLTIEPKTRFGELARAGRLPLLEERLLAESFVAVGEALAAHGFERYEVSNYAREGLQCQHNLGYWRGVDYVGLGCGAYGTVQCHEPGAATRYRNPPTPAAYARMVEEGHLGAHSEEKLDPSTRMRERLMLGLRLAEGLDVRLAADALGVQAWPETRLREVRRLVRMGRLSREGDRLRIPPEAWLWADDTACRLF